ncbi:adhesion G protein-coupled receptor L2 isoform X2 [Octopus sinensis]|uniref:Adhesion G protein-coupled receptor L2 isoform X2 n=1 Tax=Octopus sinensis TaxID=2607531 RepID=A0A6P7SN46_9MOLL|nr:adhesion G protein-coupled receptor L2 isoform X2 [Octopus sinensis]
MIFWQPVCFIVFGVILQIKAERMQTEEMVAFVCEKNNLTLDCGDNGIIRITRANYGRFTINQCNFFAQVDGWNIQCHSKLSNIVARERCDGRVSCKIPAENSIFGGDPCSGTFKYLEVHYICEKDSAPTFPKFQVAKVGDTVELMCSKEEFGDSAIQLLARIKWSKVDGKIPKRAINERNKLIIHKASLRDAGIYCCTITLGTKSFQSKITLNITSSSHRPPHIPETTTVPSTTTTTTTRRPIPVHTTKKHPEPSTVSSTTTTRRTTTTTRSTTTTTPRPKTTSRKYDIRTKSFTTQSTTPYRVISTTYRAKKCPEKTVDGIWWPTVHSGVVSERPCPGVKVGIARWQCGESHWIRPAPNYTDCVAPWLQDIANNVNGTQPQTSMGNLSKHMKASYLGSGDIIKTTKEIIPGLTRILQREVEHTKHKMKLVTNFTEGFLSVGSTMLQDNQKGGWEEMPPFERSGVATNLAYTMKTTAFKMASLLTMQSQIEIATDNIDLEIKVAEITQHLQDVKMPSSQYFRSVEDYIIIPKENLIKYSHGGLYRAVYMVYKNLDDLLNNELDEDVMETDKKQGAGDGDDGGDDDDVVDKKESVHVETRVHNKKFKESPQLDLQLQETDNDQETVETEIQAPQKINTRILSVTIDNRQNTQLEKPVVFVLKHLVDQDPRNAKCVFWNYTVRNMDGRWSRKGCQLLSTNMTHTACKCNHLTSFAVLMDFIGTKPPGPHVDALYIITFVGCILSIIGLFCCFVTFSYFRNLQSSRNTIHKNLVLCLMLAEITFLAGIHQVKNKIFCAVIAGVLHFLFLAAFCWMCLEGILLYIMLIEVFEAESRRTAFYLFGYGIPALIVGIALGVDYRGYGTDRHCWLKIDNYFILSFVVPVGIIILINMFMLILAIYMMHTHANTANSKERSTKEKINGHLSTSSDLALCGSQSKLSYLADIPGWIRAAWILIILLGLTWIFGLFYVNQETLFMAYIFNILNSLQGFFIFIFHCLLNDKVRKEYKKAIKSSTWLPECIKPCCGAASTERSSTPNPSTSSGNYFSRLLKKRKSSTTSNISKTPARIRSPVSADTTGESDYHTSKRGSSEYDYPAHHLPNRQSYNDQHMYHDVNELSLADCSVINSDYVSEYCQTNLQVSHENQLSPVISIDSGADSDTDSIVKRRDSILSRDSNIQKRDSFESDDKILELDADLLKLAEKEKLNEEYEPLMYPNSTTLENRNRINQMLNKADMNCAGDIDSISNGAKPPLRSVNNYHVTPLCHPEKQLMDDSSHQPLLQTDIIGNPTCMTENAAYRETSHSNPYSSVNVAMPNGTNSDRPLTERAKHRVLGEPHSNIVKQGRRTEELPSFSEC